MMRSLYSGISGLKTHQTRMDVIGNNIANINTIGFKGSRTTFSDMLSQLSRNSSSATETRGGVNPSQIGLGVNVESIDLLFQDSSPQQTGKNTDLALAGNGLFVLASGDQSYYTRNGAFMFDEQGYYVMPGNGLRVQGWNASPEGLIDTNSLATDIIVPTGKFMEATPTENITYSGNLNKESQIIDRIVYTVNNSIRQEEQLALVEGSGVTAEGLTAMVTGTVDADGNVNATSVNVDGHDILAATIYLKNGEKMTVTSGYYEVGRSVPITTIATIYDSLGSKHEITILIDKDSISEDANLSENDIAALSTQTGMKYTYTVTDDEGNSTTYDVRRNVTIDEETDEETVTYTYLDAEGNEQTVDEANVTATPSFDNRWRAYLAPGQGEIGPASENFANRVVMHELDGTTTTATMNNINFLYFDNRGNFVSNGQTEQGAVSFEYSDGNGAAENTGIISFEALTQFASSSTSFPTTDGNTAGILQSIAIDSSGIITGTYTNGLIRQEAQIAIAQFSNAAGLTKVGTTIYQESNNSGTANVRTVASFGLTVTASALEMSGVDLATEFADMIVTQRGFQANSKMTTVADEMLETVVNMKR